MASEVFGVSHTAGVTNSESVLLNGVNGHTYVILSIMICETAGAAETFDLYVDDGGGGTDYEIYSDQALAANATFEHTSKLVIVDEDHLCAATASSANVDIVVSYLDITRQVYMSGTISDNIDKQSGVISEPAGGVDVESSDPAASEGTVWFNTTSGVLKVYRNIGAWSSGGNMGTAVRRHAVMGTQGATLSVCGNSGSATAECEEYNGTAWTTTSVGDANTAAKNTTGCGTQTAGLKFGGAS